jgi:hypothetical protein
MRREDGASAIHSADDLCADLRLAEVLNDLPLVTSTIETVNAPFE